MTNGIFSSFHVSASGLRAQRIRLDTVAENLANIETTRTAAGGPYRPKRAVFEVADSGGGKWGSVPKVRESFRDMLANETRGAGSAPQGRYGGRAAGLNNVDVKVVEIDTPFLERFDPQHPDADETGIVRFPNVDPVSEMMNLIKATRAYEANATALDSAKEMLNRALDI